MIKTYKILATFLFIGLFWFFGPTNNAYANCTANVSFGPPASAPFNQPLTLTSTVTLSGFDNGGPNDGYCSGITPLGIGFTYRTIRVYYVDASGNTGAAYGSVTINLERNSPSVSATITIVPSDLGYKDGQALTVNAQVRGCKINNSGGCDFLTASGNKNVQLTVGIYNNYACTGPDGNGNTVYICDSKNSSDCSNTSGCTSQQPCIKLSDSNLCGKAVSPGGTHKACQNNACVVVNGAGADTCSSNANCGGGGGGGGGGPQSFEIPNPIGIDTFEELVNIIGRWIFNLSIPIAVIIIIYAGVLMLTSGGEPKRFQKGATALKWAVIGLAVVLIGKGFVSLIESILSLKD
ncbi:MAG: hypothetical protein A2831_01955 [Candidatus Yanofskybacteria bacterium RIFCSPHIGHO2_01_FULL_44_17]|uniref:Uncharacterized protein n=1 Tax=Candidatus Yanofskybacteria bacterium RIFCSPHIGHO2_01_FULL_44_17 TaxID=1802668 RepID=A0A1F8EVC0_9BACT|nr:MAG: hypothetical protein A2831_01955 [Candidatus Yanofskybacteria bacterium RIFCSPHIGHO2_01_FULL_44_17]